MKISRFFPISAWPGHVEPTYGINYFKYVGFVQEDVEIVTVLKDIWAGLTTILTDITDFIAIMSPSATTVIFSFNNFDNQISPGTTAFEKNAYVLL